jgi:Ran GTPase-activating protein (RanGAP) involved in mRNA processing and transport
LKGLSSCEKLIKLDVSNNDFGKGLERKSLECFSQLVNLEKLHLGTTKEKKNQKRYL